MSKPTLYALLANEKVLERNRGDKINESRFLTALSEHFDIYYNNVYFKGGGELFGSHDVAVAPPLRKYDLYYVRSNPEVFAKCGSPRIAMGVPYQESVFSTADALLVTTGIWGELLKSYNTSQAARDKIGYLYTGDSSLEMPKHVINISQSADLSFFTPDARKVNHYKNVFSRGFVCGYYGRLSEESMPVIAQEGVELARKVCPEVVMVYAGKIRGKMEIADGLYVGEIPYTEMPSVLGATDVVFSNEEIESEFLGSGKVIDAMLAGVPILCPKNRVRIEQLGDEYPLFYSTPSDVCRLILKVREDVGFRKEVAAYLFERSKLFLPDAIGTKFYSEYQKLKSMVECG